MSETEASADWCIEGDDFFICGTDMEEYARDSLGNRWCFRCRTRHNFDRVCYRPTGLSYYGPEARYEGMGPDCTDLFPGWYRGGEEE